MKAEPLKGKSRYIDDKLYKGHRTVMLIFKQEDVHSAVEWLKKEISRMNVDYTNSARMTFLINKIDEAFDDVIK